MQTHLPVLATVGDRLLLINLVFRGMGCLPKSELLEEFTSLFEEARAEGRPWPDTLLHHRFLRGTRELFAFDPFHELLHPTKYLEVLK